MSSVSPLLRRLYWSRGIRSDLELDYSLEGLQPPDSLLGISAAVTALAGVITRRGQILVVGDFDADGATSTALACGALRQMGARVDYLIPSRFEHGYGLTPEIVALAGTGGNPDLIVTVDNGIASVEGVVAARAAGIQVVITDHHLPGECLPPADAIVNPNQAGCSFPSKAAAGVVVIFYVMVALRRHLEGLGWFARLEQPAPRLANYLDLVALGVIADLVPLDRNNRILVHQGVRRMRAGAARPGIQALMAVSRVKPDQLDTSALGYLLAPRLNAAGRLDDMSLGVRCLLAEDYSEAQSLAARLDEMNRERRRIETDMRRQAEVVVDGLSRSARVHELPAGICLYQPDWHQGVVGIVAGRLKDRFSRPVIVFAPGSEGEIKGSARSIPGFHIRDALASVASRYPDMIEKFGGHAMAAGLSLPLAVYPRFCEAFDAEVRRQFPDGLAGGLIETDGPLSEGEMTLDTVALLNDGGPWGQQFPPPVFDDTFLLLSYRVVGDGHLQLKLRLSANGEVLEGIHFRADPEVLELVAEAERVHLVYRLSVNEFRQRRRLQLMVDAIQAER